MKFRRFYVLTFLSIGVGALVTLALMQPVFGTRADFSIFNTRWNGASDLARDVYGTGGFVPMFSVSFEEENVTVIQRSFAEFDVEPRSASLLLLGPAKAPTSEEAAWLNDFVGRGGRVLIADDFGEGNAFLEAAGATTRFDGGLMLDLAFAKKPEFVVAAEFEPHALTVGVSETVLDYPTAILPGESARVLARTDSSAWIDRNSNVFKDGRDPAGPFPWLAEEQVGSGSIIVLSDPSILINGMRDLADNAAFEARVVAWLSEGGRQVLVDESHHDYPDPVKFLGATLAKLPDGARLGLALASAGAFLWFALAEPGAAAARPLAVARRLVARIFPEPEAAPADLVARVRARHPDWDEKALRDIVASWREPRP